jgi:hypothetical protein
MMNFNGNAFPVLIHVCEHRTSWLNVNNRAQPNGVTKPKKIPKKYQDRVKF